ncbi:hypothetical protein K6T25_12155 [Halobaculum rubrum]|nr:hypothetical protein [Halobaculum rubrum]QZX99002.1 hypothetical protein K6T25_12155 [Halobaculum rubrum]
MAYSDLRRAVGERDSGKFSYHLDKLTGRFVEKADAGYRLREPGREAVRLLDRGVVDGPIEFHRAPVDASCPFCGGGVRVQYSDHHVISYCTECEGLFDADETPEGTLSGVVLPPATVRTVTPSRCSGGHIACCSGGSAPCSTACVWSAGARSSARYVAARTTRLRVDRPARRAVPRTGASRSSSVRPAAAVA